MIRCVLVLLTAGASVVPGVAPLPAVASAAGTEPAARAQPPFEAESSADAPHRAAGAVAQPPGADRRSGGSDAAVQPEGPAVDQDGMGRFDPGPEGRSDAEGRSGPEGRSGSEGAAASSGETTSGGETASDGEALSAGAAGPEGERVRAGEAGVSDPGPSTLAPSAPPSGDAGDAAGAGGRSGEPREVTDTRQGREGPGAREERTADGSWRERAAGPLPHSLTGDLRSHGVRVFSGEAFDTCNAPAYSAMRAWRKSSPYRAVGVYIGGRGRACPQQPNLTPDWVRGVHRMGWKLMPIYVGSQAPCVTNEAKRKYAMSHSAPRNRGLREGRDAVQQAKDLGMVRRSAIYLDMEAYDQGDSRCGSTTLKFIQGWNRAVRSAGYLPAFYSSATSGVAHMERARKAGAGELPMAMWFARWTGRPSLDSESAISERSWRPHRRAHQYEGNVKRTHGGTSLHIDRNVIDGPVAIVR